MIRDLEERRLSLDAVLAQVDAWNLANPVGTLVDYWRGVREGEPSGQGRTRWNATVLGDHTAVAWIDGCSGAVALTHVRVVEEPSAVIS